ncbi:hypothetical protein [Pseudoxanthomonas putridarboris]|uniref:Uncharacterized protein n=1 Tax=Pseudoxanthomonas putridarboris TaxID=752605 RepID=A0ABU9IWJ2_9GAMM
MGKLGLPGIALPGNVAGLLIAVGLMAVFGVAIAANPPITTANRTLILRVQDGSVSHNGVTRPTFSMGGLVIVGADAYVTKNDVPDDNGTGWATFYHIDNFNTPSAVVAPRTIRMKGSTAPVDMGHVNGMAYYRWPGTDPLEVGSFYIPMLKAVGDHQIAQVNNQGEITAFFKARQGAVEKKIASIAHYGGGIFIVGTGGENIADPSDANQILKPYYTAIIDGDWFELGDMFYVPTTKQFNIGQDIHYEPADDELLVPVWDGKNTVGTATGRKNRIIVVKLGNIQDGRVYAPRRWIDLTVPASDASKFEIEGLSRDAGGKLFVASNITNPAGTANIDGIHKLTGQ